MVIEGGQQMVVDGFYRSHVEVYVRRLLY